MEITYEQHKELSLIYVYLRSFDGLIVKTIPYVKAALMLDEKDNWIGFEVFNYLLDEGKIALPGLHSPYLPHKDEIVEVSKDKIVEVSKDKIVEVSKDKILVIFDSKASIHKHLEAECNIDYSENGLQGFEFILTDFIGKLEIASRFF